MAEHLELVMCSFRMTVKVRTSKKHPVPTKRAAVSVIVAIPCNFIVTEVIGMHLQLPKLSSEIQIFNFAYLSPAHPILT